MNGKYPDEISRRKQVLYGVSLLIGISGALEFPSRPGSACKDTDPGMFRLSAETGRVRGGCSQSILTVGE